MTGLGEPVYVEKVDAVAEMVEQAGNALPNNICTSKEIARAALESLGIPLTVLAALRSGEWVALPVKPTEEMLDAHWSQTGESEAMRLRTHAYMRRYFSAMIDAAPKEP